MLYRPVPLVGSLAYLGEGPVVDWAALGAENVLDPLLAYLRTRGVFSVMLAPDLVLRRWRVETLRSVLRSGTAQRLRDVPPDDVSPVALDVVDALRGLGWTQYEAPGPGFGGQMHPRYRSHVPLSPDADPVERLDGQWRRNLRKASGSGGRRADRRRRRPAELLCAVCGDGRPGRLPSAAAGVLRTDVGVPDR